MRMALLVLLVSLAAVTHAEPIVPAVEGEWWTIAENPQLPESIRSERQEPVDFGLWQAADGTWQLWSCIRHTNIGGHTRLFFGWEGASLDSEAWAPQGIKMEARPDLGEEPGGLQAPHVVKLENRYLMAYGDWNSICFAESKDGKHFERIVQPSGSTAVFGEGPGSNTRDAMLIEIDGLWHVYYTAILGDKGYGLCRTSRDLATWSPSFVVSYGGRVGPSPWHNECPHVVEVQPGDFVYFRNQFYGENQSNWAYYSQNPRYFGIDDDDGLVAQLPVAAPEVIRHDGQYYIASLKPGLDGIQLAKLAFYRRGERGAPVFDFDTAEGRAGWKVKEGAFPVVFTDSPHQDFECPTEYLIGTAENPEGGYDDGYTGVIASPSFTLEPGQYEVYVSGGGDRETTYVALIDDATGQELARWTGHWSNVFRAHHYGPVTESQKVRLRVVDQQTDGWGHINFGGIFEVDRGARVAYYDPESD